MSHVQRVVVEVGAFVGVVALLAVLAAGFVMPWRGEAATRGLARYLPAEDGHSYLTRETGADGSITWISGNVRRVPALRALNEWRTGPRNALRDFLSGGEELSEEALVAHFRSAAAVETRERLLAADGTVTERITYTIRDDRGDWYVGTYDTAAREDTLFDPPLLSAPADLAPGATWSSKGAIGVASYAYDVTVVEAGPHTSELGAFDDCLKTESTLTFTPSDDDPVVTRSTEWICAEAGGSVGYTTHAEEGVRSSVTVATHDRPAAASPPASPTPQTEQTVPRVDDDWDLARIGRTSRSGDSTEATIAPVYVPGSDPLILGASHGGDLVAFAAGTGAEVRWRFRPGGTIYGSPSVDRDTGRIFFGATDKRVYALDRNGMYLWSHPTGDSVATTPLVVDDTVIVGSEDRRVYALDAATGDRRWSYDTGDAIVSSPALIGDVVAIGSDSGGVVGLAAADGTLRWSYDLGEPVEAPIAVTDDAFVVAGNDGMVAAVAADDGDTVWTAEVGSGVRAAPTVGDDVAVVVDAAGDAYAFETADGATRWSTTDGGYVGSVAIVANGVVAVDENGTVSLLGLTAGARQATWDAADSAGSSDRPPVFRLGATTGGEALWMADDDSVLRRLGPPDLFASGPAPLRTGWFKSFADAPYENTLSSPAAADGQTAVLIDETGVVLRTDPLTGAGRKLGSIAIDKGTVTGPVLSDGRLFTVAGRTLYAVTFPAVDPLWTYDGQGTSLQRPVVIGDLVVFATVDEGDGSSGVTGTVHAVDAASGDVRWTTDLPDVGPGIGVSAEGDRIFAGGAALDAGTGEQLWRHVVPDHLAISGTASSDGVHYMAALNPKTDEAAVVALAEDGSELWTAATDDVLSVIAAPLVSDGTVVISGHGGGLVALDAGSGEMRWSWDGSAPLIGVAGLDDGRVWAPTTDAHVTVIDAATGAEVAEFTEVDLELEPFAKLQQPVAVEGHVIVPLGALLVGFQAPGGS